MERQARVRKYPELWPRVTGGLIGFLAGIGLYVWALQVEASRIDAAKGSDICGSVDAADCAFHGGFFVVGKALSDTTPAEGVSEMISFGIVVATAIFVWIGTWIGAMVGRRETRRAR